MHHQKREINRVAHFCVGPFLDEGWDFEHFLVQPMDCADLKASHDASIALAMERPKWRLTLQAHKVVGLK